MDKSTELPAWDIVSEYPGLDSPGFVSDEQSLAEYVGEVRRLGSEFAFLRELSNPSAMQQERKSNLLHAAFLADSNFSIVFFNLRSYVHCLLAMDGNDAAARAKASALQIQESCFRLALQPLMAYLCQAPEDEFQRFIAHPQLKGSEFFWRRQRQASEHLLSEQEEALLVALKPGSFTAWAELRNSLSGSMRVNIERGGQRISVGLSEAGACTKSANVALRRSAWQGIQSAWDAHRDTAAAIVNSLASWRLTVSERRAGAGRGGDFLQQPLFDNRIERSTLDAMLGAVWSNNRELRHAITLMAKASNVDKLEPCDLLAPSPRASTKPIGFATAIRLVKTGLASVDSGMADFVDTMVNNRWIEARICPGKRGGAFCTGFAKSLTPRVFLSYLGSPWDVSCLAHELGHAFHAWSLRDLPLAQQDIPSTLCETASIFSETLVRDALLESSIDKGEEASHAWSDAQNAAYLLINIPARYEFECRFYEARKTGFVGADELCAINNTVWQKWYGATLANYDTLSWAHQAHFSTAGTGFYNFPYVFGYLFSLSIYARRSEFGADFVQMYLSILRDTGRMTVEELARKHLNADIGTTEFWQRAIDAVKSRIARFELSLN